MEHRKILQHWPNTSELARDLKLDVSLVFKWIERNHIPSRHWPGIVILWEKRRAKLDAEAKKKITLEDFV